MPQSASIPWRGWRLRALAAAVDAVVGLGLAILLASSTGTYFAERAVATLHIGSPGTRWTGPVPLVLGAISPLAYGAPFAFLLVGLMEPLFATSPGKLLFRGEIVPATPDARRRRLCGRFAIKAAPAWLACGALVTGQWPVALASAVAAAVVLLGCAPLVAARPPLHDRVAGTLVAPRRQPAGIALGRR
jgi:hypothetical protein